MKNKKNLYNGLLIVIVTVLVLFFALKDDFLEKIEYLFSFNIWWLFFAILLVFLYWFLKSLVIYFCARKFDDRYPLKKAFNLIMGTQFFNAVTPFSTGGQPYQIYKFKKHGFSLEKGTNIIIQDFIVYQIALILLGTIAIVTNNIFNIFPEDSFLEKLVFIGYLINLSVIILLFIVAFNKKGNRLILNLIIKIGARLKFIKNEEQFLDKSNETIENFHNNALFLMKSKIMFINIIIINLIALVCLYLVPFMLIMGLGESISPLVAIMTSAYVMLIGSFVPIPGGSGGLEFSFVRFYGYFVVGAKLSSIMIVWRLITYYLGLFVGAIFVSKGDD